MSDAPDNVVGLRSLSSFKEATGLAERLRTELAALSNVYADDLAGYVVVCVNGKGEWTVAWRCDEASPIGRTMLAGLALAGIQHDMIADSAAGEALVRNGLRDPPPDDPA